jgi:hypothetical protein
MVYMVTSAYDISMGADLFSSGRLGSTSYLLISKFKSDEYSGLEKSNSAEESLNF